MARSRPPADPANARAEDERAVGVPPDVDAEASGGDGYEDDGYGDDGYGDDGYGEAPPGVSRWVPITAFVLSLLGLADSTYLTITHFSHTKLFCPSSGFINCQAVTTSAQSRLLGIPVAFLGLIFYVALTAINLPPLWRRPERWIAWTRLAMVVGGMAMVIWLLVAELFIIKNLCEYCTGVHIVTFLLFILVVATFPNMVAARGTWEEWEDGDAGTAAG